MGNIRLTTEQFIEKAKIVHGEEYEYSKVEYINNHTKVCIVHKKCGNEFWQIPYKHLSGQGCPFCSKTKPKLWEEVHNEFIKVHGDEYDYSKVEFKNMNTKVCIIHKKCGSEFWQTPKNHLRGQGCPFCKSERIGLKMLKTKEEVIDNANNIHNFKYDYSKVDYVNSKEKVCIICPIHGEFWQTPDAHLQGQGCPSCSHKDSKAEKEIAQHIRNNSNLIVENNVRGILPNNKELDIYIPEKKIAIEYNGMRWHSELYSKDRSIHLKKLEECNKLGIKLIQVFETEYILHKDIVLDKIMHNLGASNTTEKIYARKCVVNEIDMRTAREFLEKNHIQGYVRSSVYLGCFYNKQIVGVMTFKRETSSSNKWELSRFATDNARLCCGVAGKMFKYFTSLYNPSEVKSFADRRWTLDKDNNLYTKLGFTLKETLKPDYRYTKAQTDYLHKFGFRKQKLHKKYNLPLTMTENEMTKELGYYKIWDCGLFKYVWVKLK